MTPDPPAATALTFSAFFGALLFGQVLAARGWTVALVVGGAALQAIGVLMIVLILRRTGERFRSFLTSKFGTVHITGTASMSFGGAATLTDGKTPTTEERVDALEKRIVAVEEGFDKKLKAAKAELRKESQRIAHDLAKEINDEIKRLTDTLVDMASVEDKLQKVAAALVVLGIGLSTAGAVIPLYVDVGA